MNYNVGRNEYNCPENSEILVDYSKWTNYSCECRRFTEWPQLKNCLSLAENTHRYSISRHIIPAVANEIASTNIMHGLNRQYLRKCYIAKSDALICVSPKKN